MILDIIVSTLLAITIVLSIVSFFVNRRTTKNLNGVKEMLKDISDTEFTIGSYVKPKLGMENPNKVYQVIKVDKIAKVANYTKEQIEEMRSFTNWKKDTSVKFEIQYTLQDLNDKVKGVETTITLSPYELQFLYSKVKETDTIFID